MPGITEKLIAEKTLELASKKPVNKITVKEIVSACSITRNTFYYHYHDVYDVLNAIMQDKLTEFYENSELDLDERLFDLIDYCASYKKVWHNLYKGIGRERFSDYVGAKMKELISYNIDNYERTAQISRQDREIICEFYSEAIIGVMIGWIENGNYNGDKQDLMNWLDRIRKLFTGQVELIVTNSMKYPIDEGN
jgi:AcrR family transcriptional regulator